MMSIEMPAISHYGRPENTVRVDVGELTTWFSYTTCVAFRFRGGRLVVRENAWGPTTGKHLNLIDGGNQSSRVNATTFNALYAEMAKERGIKF